VTERSRLAAQLTYRALHDELTGLANRQLFMERLEHAGRQPCGEGASQVAVLYVDLDRFKETNDTGGHAAGDAVLKAVAERLSSLLRPVDTAARLGGDEFAVLLDGVSGLDEALDVGQRLLVALTEPVPVRNGDVVPGASIGVAATTPEKGADPEVLLAQADAAMYLAKQEGNQVVAHGRPSAGVAPQPRTAPSPVTSIRAADARRAAALRH